MEAELSALRLRGMLAESLDANSDATSSGVGNMRKNRFALSSTVLLLLLA